MENACVYLQRAIGIKKVVRGCPITTLPSARTLLSGLTIQSFSGISKKKWEGWDGSGERTFQVKQDTAAAKVGVNLLPMRNYWTK
jgi:hypothetical protein